MYNKICRRCDQPYKSKGPAGTHCNDCKVYNKYIRIEKGISYNELKGLYKVAMRRNGEVLHSLCDSIEEARQVIEDWKVHNPKQANTGVNNNYCRSGKIGSLHNYLQTRNAIRQQDTFICNRCNKEVDTEYLNLHHIDHDRTNDAYNNFEILCSWCHREHHNTKDSHGKYTNQSSETIPNGSTLK